jgi:hypothetical protein
MKRSRKNMSQQQVNKQTKESKTKQAANKN